MRRLAVVAAVAALWLPSVHLLFRRAPESLVGPLTEHLLTADRAALRRSNPEWDLMARTFTVLAFLNQAERQPERRPQLLAAVDGVLAETLALDAGAEDAFVLPYFHRAPFRDAAAKSVFVDGEVALMLAARELVAPAPRWRDELRLRVDRATAAMERGPVLSAESYPDELWTFCNTIALAATRLSDAVDGRAHSDLRRRWVALAQARLVDPRTGLLLSSFTWEGRPLDGPEGSTLFLAAHMLQVVDEDFAAEQYWRARQALGGGALGFAWAAEWPESWAGRDDIDSGPTVPLLRANAGASGLALVGAAAFGDREFLDGLVASLELGAFPVRDAGGLRFAAGNTLADAVLLYALVQGPLWQRVREARS